jgi:hypothetical protein
MRRGCAGIDVSTNVPTIGAWAVGCPNGNWRVIVGDVEFTSHTLTISPGGQLVVTCQGREADTSRYRRSPGLLSQTTSQGD